MKKKILIGSLLVLTLLLLMPSIPAVQQKTIEDKAYSDFVEELSDIKVLELIRHPILYTLVMFLFFHRIERGVMLLEISTEHWNFPYNFDIIHPVLFCWFLWIYLSLEIYSAFWNNVSDKFGWGWNVSPFPT